jgi:glutathione synthase/RimK-type ligase-like ATP-grasp enzyme
MKKIGILFGQEHSFPPAFVERVNAKTGGNDIRAEFVKIDKVIQGEPCGYDVVIDRISQDVPFYRAWSKNAALTGTAVVNNPFWWSADEKFFNNGLATKIDVAVPKTVLLPSHQVPPDTNDNSQPWLSTRLGRNIFLRWLACVLQAVCRRRLEKCLSAA